MEDVLGARTSQTALLGRRASESTAVTPAIIVNYSTRTHRRVRLSVCPSVSSRFLSAQLGNNSLAASDVRRTDWAAAEARDSC